MAELKQSPKDQLLKILYISYAGDFSEAYSRLFIDKGEENYYGQKYSVGAVIEQARAGHDILVLVLHSDGFDEILETGLRTIGLTERQNKYDRTLEIIEGFHPDRVILRLPDPKLLRILRKKDIPTLPVFADSFDSMGRFRGRIEKYLLSRELKKDRIRWVANHQLNASLSLWRLGIAPDKILPYDWEHPYSPQDWDKIPAADITSKEISLFYAGSITQAKGVFDLIDALPYVIEQGREVSLQLAGTVTQELIEAIDHRGLKEKVNLLGIISHDDLLGRMNRSDVVVVPSRHAYPEGLPMTLIASLLVGTPVVASDHPMFVGRVGERGGVHFFHEKNSQSLAETILKVCSDYTTYSTYCEKAQIEWSDICLDLKWADMINQWISDPHGCDFSPYSVDKLVSAR